MEHVYYTVMKYILAFMPDERIHASRLVDILPFRISERTCRRYLVEMSHYHLLIRISERGGYRVNPAYLRFREQRP